MAWLWLTGKHRVTQCLGQPASFALDRIHGHTHQVLGDFEAALQDYTQALAAARHAGIIS